MIREPRIYTLTSTLFTYTPLCPSLKIGIGTTADADLRSRDDLVRWFRGPGAEANRREFRAFLTALLPPLARCRNWHADTCAVTRSEEHTSELQSLMRISYAVFCLKK